MTCHVPLPSQSQSASILVTAARCRHRARARGAAILPCLSEALADHDGPILAPVFDSLIRFYEAALERTMLVGDVAALSDDERSLLGLLDDSGPHSCIHCRNDIAIILDCALCSTRIMLALAFQPSALRIPAVSDPDNQDQRS